MTDRLPVRPRACLVQGPGGALQGVYYPAAAGATARGDLLYVPPFTEEMNRCRAMAAMQAHALAELGFGTLVLDPRGTGDSAGEFVEGTWSAWRDDLQCGIDWLRSHGNGCAGLWGVRLGAIMAAELAVRDGRVPRLLLWQPVLNGKTFFTQFLRIRIAAEIDQPDGVKSTETLRSALAAGESIEVSGYRVGPALGADLDKLQFPAANALGQVEVSWLEVLPSADATPPRASTKLVEDQGAAGVRIGFQTVVGPPFWQVHEREVAPELIDATARAVDGWSGLPQPAQDAARPVTEMPADAAELPLTFPCATEQLFGVLHRTAGAPRRGVVIVVAGGPQYRAGAHRQFVSMARKLSHNGYPVLRFDLRGMGDSTGAHLGYQGSEPDIRAAIDTMFAQHPGLEQVVLLGECESASGITFYAWRDRRVAGAVLINPWVRTEEGQAQVIVKHYYLDRLRSPQFWKKVREGRFNIGTSASSFAAVFKAFLRGRRQMARAGGGAQSEDGFNALPLPVRTAEGLRRFKGRALLLMSGRDYIAREFDEVTAASKAWDGVLQDARITRFDVAEADHTFSRDAWKGEASDKVVAWMGGW